MSLILTCTDGSAYAPSVYDHTAWAARRMGAKIQVLHTLDPHKESSSLTDLSGSLKPDALESLMGELVALDEAKARVAQIKGKAILDDAVLHLEAAGLLEIKTELRYGPLVETVGDYEAHSDLVVVGKRGKSADFAKLHLGGNLQRIIRSSHHPVLVASRSFVPIERFLLAFDGGPSAHKAVAHAVSDPLLRGLECHLVMAGAAEPTPEFEGARIHLQQAGYRVHATTLPGTAEDVIAEAVRDRNIHLLVMGAYGHSRIRQLVLGSTTTTMIRVCQVPVLMFR